MIAPAIEAQAPAKIAAFLSVFPDLHDRSLCLQFLPQIDPELSAANPPVRQERLRGRQLLLSLIPEFPWPRYNSGFLDSRSLEPVESNEDIAYESALRLRGSVVFGFAPASVMMLRAPDVITLPVKSIFKLRLARPKPAVSFGPVRLFTTEKHRALPGFGYRSFVELVPVEQPLSQKISPASPVELTSPLAISGSLRVRSESTARGLGFLDRVFKMRPRMAVLCVDLPLMWQIASEPLSSTVNLIRPSDLGVVALSHPVRLDRFLRFRPCGPLDSQILTQCVPPFASEKTEARPGIPDLRIKQSEFSPTAPARPFRMSMRAAAGRSAEAIAINFALDFATGPVNPGFSSTSDCAPSLADRFYRPRPRGPVLDQALLTLHRVNLEENGFVSQPAICELDKPVLTFQPGLSDRLFRMRPRSGVVSESVADLIPSTTPEGLVSPPAMPGIAGLNDASPSVVTRIFRMRPGSGLNSRATAIQLPSLTTPISAAATDLAIAKFNPALPHLSPAFQDRAFRIRSRTGISSDRTQSTESITAAPAWAVSSPSVIGFVSSKARHLAPPLLDKLYRGKPKPGVPSPSMANLMLDGASRGAIRIKARSTFHWRCRLSAESCVAALSLPAEVTS